MYTKRKGKKRNRGREKMKAPKNQPKNAVISKAETEHNNTAEQLTQCVSEGRRYKATSFHHALSSSLFPQKTH